MSEAAAGVALLLVGVAVAGHVTTLATVVAQRLALLPGVLAVSGDVAALPTVVTGCRDGDILQCHYYFIIIIIINNREQPVQPAQVRPGVGQL